MTQPEDAETMSADIRHKRDALTACPKGHRDRVQLAAALGEVLRTGYRNIRDINLVKEGIEVEREVLALRPRGHPDRALSCSNLGFSLHEYYEQAGDVTLLDEAIKLKRKALTLRPPGHLHRALTCANLGTSLYARYQRCGDLAMLDEAIVLEREALSLRPPGHPLRAFSCNNLANSLHVCYSQCGDITLFDEAIELDREALVLRPPGHPDRAISCTNLATSLHARYEQCGDVTLFNEAIDLDHEALALRPPDHPDRAVSCNNLATSLHMRYKQCGALTLLDESIKFKREALALQPPGHPERAASCANLGASLYARYQRCDDLILLHEAIKHQREALALRSPGHPLRAVSCNDLANSLHLRCEQCGDLALFDEAIELDREALVLRPPGHPQQSLNPSYSLIELYKRTKDVALLDEVIALCDHALKSGDALEASRSFAILSGVYSIPGTPYFSTVKALRCLHVSFGRNVDSIHDFIRSTNYSLSQFWSLSGSTWTPEARQLLCEIYFKIIDLLPLAAGFVLDTQSRLQILKYTHRIGTDAYMAAVLAGQPTTAVELLDRAHGLVWMQALHQRDPQMKGAPPALASELAGHLHAMAAPAAQLEEPLHRYQDDRHRRSTRAHALLREIRAKPGLERFMLGITYETLRAAARSHAVVVLAAGRGHAFALIMSSATEYHPHALHLDLTSDDLQLLQSAAQDAGLRSRADTQEGGGLDARIGYKTSGLHVHHKPFRVLAKIWHKIVKPVIDYLQLERATGRSRPRLHWCTNGGFVFLTLHAAGIYQGPASDQVCCSDYVVSSYTPTVSALLRAQARAASVTSGQVDMLLVGEDCAKNSALNRLWSVRRELECIELVAKSQQFGRAVEVIGSAATIQQVTERVKSASFLHLACHGIQDQTNALESGFYLSDGKLTISKLMDLQLDKPWLAYLSACETAKGDANQPDQVMHLAAAMLFAGFKHVIATMWVMGDADGPDLAKRFYEDLMSNEIIDADAVAYALDGAVRKLREKEVSPQRWAPFIHMGA